LGYAAGRLLLFAREHHITREGCTLIYVSALALTVLGVTRLLGTDGILAVFTAGRGYVLAVNPHERMREKNAEEALSHFLLLPVFVFFGAVIPWHEWAQWGWEGVVLVIGVLSLRRLPWILLGKHWLGPVSRWRSVLFLGWFGPIGVAALFYAMLSVREIGFLTGWHIASLIIFASVFVHGLTATPLTLMYDRHRRRSSVAYGRATPCDMLSMATWISGICLSTVVPPASDQPPRSEKKYRGLPSTGLRKMMAAL
jgi:NhaP-type Na+/H+ or K+/H+ antiporter